MTSDRITEIAATASDWRRHLHQMPELQFEEHQTASFIAELLRSFGCDEVHTGIRRSGVVATIVGRLGKGPRAIAIRADIDALPIIEATDVPYRSRIEGRMHACGHDGHTAILLGTAKYLAETRAFAGTAVLIFQPAEEGGAGGASAMIADGLFQRFPCDEIYGLHNWPGIPVGQFAIKPGPLLASFDTFEIRVEGVGGHSATPHNTVDTVLVMSQIVTALQSIVARNTDPHNPVVVSVCTIHAGDANNIIPQTGFLTGSVRALSTADQLLCEARMRSLVESVAAGFGAKASLGYKRVLPVTINSDQCAAFLAKAAQCLVGPERVDLGIRTQMGGEDFAFFLQQEEGAFILLGNGNSAGLQSPKYDYDDDATHFGIALWVTLIEHRLSKDTLPEQ